MFIRKSSFITSILLLFSIAASYAQTHAQKPSKALETNSTLIPELSIELFTKLPKTRQVEISPDGKHIAVILKNGEKDMLGIIRLSDVKLIKMFTAAGENNQIGNVIWANNERLLYNILSHAAWDKQLFYNGELYGVDIDGGRHRPLMGLNARRKGGSRIGNFGHHDITNLLPEDENYILVTFYPWREGYRYFHADHNAKPVTYRLNINVGRIRPIKKLPTPLASAITDTEGVVRLSFGTDENNLMALHHIKERGDDWQELELKGIKNYKRASPLRFASKNEIYLLIDEVKGPDSLYLYNLATHNAKKIFQHEVSDIQKVVYNKDGNKIVALSIEQTAPEYFILDKEDKIAQLHSDLLKQLPGFNVRVTSVSDNAERAIIEVHSDYDPGGYYLYQKQTGNLSPIIDNRKWIKPEQMASREPVSFKVRDGLTIRGYLTRPMGKTQSLPTVILPHGGPHGVKDSWDFDWESQLLANRGYAVLQLNFRGSGGYGYAYEKSGYGQWGAAMQDDLTDATLQLIEQGIADKNRICIYGASYGGYAALMGIIREPDLYRCAIGSMGVYDLPMMFNEGDVADTKSGIAFLKRVLGEDIEQHKRYSPAFNTDKIKVPLLLIHGERDERAPIEHLISLEKGLKANNKPYAKLVLKNEAHGYYDEENRIKVYSRIIEFLDQHIGATH